MQRAMKDKVILHY